jgi:hypothetical protein
VREEDDEDEDNEEGEFQDESDKEMNINKEGAASSASKQGAKEGTSSHNYKGKQAGLEGWQAQTEGEKFEEGRMIICKKMRTEPEINQDKSWVTGGDKEEGVAEATEGEVDPSQTQ